MSFDRKTYRTPYMRRYRAMRKAKGGCVNCLQPAVPGRIRCAIHARQDTERIKRRHRARRALTKCAFPPCLKPIGYRRKYYCSQACATAYDPLRNRALVCRLCFRPVKGWMQYCNRQHAQYARMLRQGRWKRTA